MTEPIHLTEKTKPIHLTEKTEPFNPNFSGSV